MLCGAATLRCQTLRSLPHHQSLQSLWWGVSLSRDWTAGVSLAPVAVENRPRCISSGVPLEDLFAGASKFLQESQVKVSSATTSLEIRLQLPISTSNPKMVEWKLMLSPLFSRVEPLLTTRKARKEFRSLKHFQTSFCQ